MAEMIFISKKEAEAIYGDYRLMRVFNENKKKRNGFYPIAILRNTVKMYLVKRGRSVRYSIEGDCESLNRVLQDLKNGRSYLLEGDAPYDDE